MDLTLLLGLIAAAVAIFVFCGWKLHNYSENEYGYSPFNIPHAALAVGSVVAGYCGLLQFRQTDGTIPGLFSRITSFSMAGADWGTLFFVAVAIFLVGLIYYRSYRESNHWIALGATVILESLAVIVVLVVVLWYLMRASEKARKARKG